MKIEGTVALVTGGASGIGKAVCQKLLQRGAKVNNETDPQKHFGRLNNIKLALVSIARIERFVKTNRISSKT